MIQNDLLLSIQNLCEFLREIGFPCSPHLLDVLYYDLNFFSVKVDRKCTQGIISLSFQLPPLFYKG